MKPKQMVFLKHDVTAFGTRWDSISDDRLTGLIWDVGERGVTLTRSLVMDQIQGKQLPVPARVTETAFIPWANVKAYKTITETPAPPEPEPASAKPPKR
jgi:hypothetical protein